MKGKSLDAFKRLVCVIAALALGGAPAVADKKKGSGA